MSLTEPNSEIYLLKTPIELDNNNQLTFTNATAQYNYFSSLPKINISEATFQRKDGFIRYPQNMEAVLGYNYCMYRNKNHGNKWFYAFVTGVEWLSENSCAIRIKTDVWQTWFTQLQFHPCFVERETVNDDTFGKHTIPEGLEYGEYIVKDYSQVDLHADIGNCYVVLQVSDMPAPMYSFYSGNDRVYNGVPQGCILLGVPIVTVGGGYDFVNLNTLIGCFDNYNKANAIVSMFIVPGAMIGTPLVISFNIPESNPTGGSTTYFQFECFSITRSDNAYDFGNTTVSRPTTIDGYTPKNNKCFCSPYNYLLASNNNGANVAYAYELFNGTPTFKTRGTLTQGCDIKLTPTNYKFTDTNGGYDYSVTCAKFPMLSWNSDYYLNWCAVNAPIQEVQATLTGLSFGLGLVGGMITGDFSGTGFQSAASLGQDVAKQLQQIREAKMTPDSAKGNTTGGDISFSLNQTGFKLYRMTVRNEYIRMIDDYFTCYGYKINSLKTPDINGRTYWNYVKTVGCNVTADAPQEDIEEIRSLFDRGITFWHDPTKFLDYTQNNTIVTP